MLPAGKPDFSDQAFVYLDFYFVRASNLRFGEFKSGSLQFCSVQTTDSRHPQAHLDTHWIAWKIGRLYIGEGIGFSVWPAQGAKRWRVCCSTKSSYRKWCLSSPGSVGTLPAPAQVSPIQTRKGGFCNSVVKRVSVKQRCHWVTRRLILTGQIIF